ncbi:MAG: alpha/beta fold hydrolase [Angustibacter sp.]
MRSPSRMVLGMGAGLAAAGAGAALGLAAERWTAGRSFPAADEDEPHGSLRGVPVAVQALDGTVLYTEVDDPDMVGASRRGNLNGALDGGAAPQPPTRPATELPASGGRVTVVFSHGFCLNQDVWHYQRRWLRGRSRMVFWDQRGHGRSGLGPSGHYTLDQCGEDLRAVIEAVAPDGPLVLVGHSMGGMATMALVARHPDLVRRRVVGVGLLATSAGGLSDVHLGIADPVGRVAHRVAPRALAGLTRTPWLVDRTRRLGSDVERYLVRRYSFASPVPTSLVRFAASMIAATPLDVVSGFLPGFDLHDKAEALDVLTGMPTLVLSGAADLLTPPEHSTAIATRLSDVEHVLVPHAGHLVMLEHPDVVNLALGDLVGRVGQPPRTRRRR